MLMELRHLRYFIVVAEELHFGRAAARLHIEQSPLSRAIKELEDDLGVLLFERTTRSSRLTYVGGVLLEEARHVLAAAAQARAKVAEAAHGYRGHLRSGGTFPIGAVGPLMAQGDLVVISLHFRAEKTGASISMSGVDLLRIAEGRIREVWLFFEDQAAEDAFWG